MRFTKILGLVMLGVLALLALAAIWLFAGQQLVSLLDRVATSPAEILPVGRYNYSPTAFTIGDTKLELFDSREIPVDIRYDIDASGRITLHTQGKAFPLGTRIGPPRADGLPEFPFTADDGDVVTFTRDRSLLPWPTPFEVNWMGGPSPIWRRNVYYRLKWRKKSGESLALVWRFEEGYIRDRGWAPNSRLGYWGLIDTNIVGPADGQVESVDQYLRRTKGWFCGDYRLEPAGVSADGHYDVVRIIHRDDEKATHPGGGLSVELLLDRKTHKIMQERGMQ
jgi:hypothetical protein